MEKRYSGILLKRVMIRNITPVFLFLLIFSCRGKIEQVNEIPKKDTALKILIWGLPDRDQRIAMDLVAKKYGFEYHSMSSVGGCVMAISVALYPLLLLIENINYSPINLII